MNIKRVCSDLFRAPHACSEPRKIMLMAAKTQFFAHRFCCVPMMVRNDNPKKSICYRAVCAQRVQ